MAKRLVVLVSGTGSNLGSLLTHADLGGRIVLVVSDRADAGGLARAEAAGVPTATVLPGDHADRAAWDGALAEVVAAAAPDLVVLAGFMRILAPDFVRRWPVLNVHPSLLPAFPGAHAVADALAWGTKVTGVTVHFVDEEVDHGPIVAQRAVDIAADDTPEVLHERIKAVEHVLYPACVELFCRDRLQVHGRHVRILP
jgi:phosphoribosylglycinamide formyltransferase 1